MTAEQFAQLKAIVDEIGVLTAAGELFHQLGDSKGDNATAEAIGDRLAKLDNLLSDLQGLEYRY